MNERIGYPEFILDTQQLDKKYEVVRTYQQYFKILKPGIKHLEISKLNILVPARI